MFCTQHLEHNPGNPFFDFGETENKEQNPKCDYFDLHLGQPVRTGIGYLRNQTRL